MPVHIWLVVTVIFLAGCASPGNGPVNPVADEEALPDAEGTGEFSLGLSDLHANQEWVLYEVEADASGLLSVETDTVFDFPPDGTGATARPSWACQAGWVGSVPFHRIDASPFSTAAGSSVGATSQDASTVGYGVDGGQSISIPIEPSGTSIPILFGLDQPEAWYEAGASYRINVTANAPISWRIIDSGTLDCGVGPSAYEGGEWIQAGDTIHARGLHQGFDFEESGHVWIFGESKGKVSGNVVGPSGEAWSADWNQAQEPQPVTFRYNVVLARLDPGEWTHTLHEFTGPWERFGYLALDVHPLLQPDPVDQEPQP